MINDTLKKIKRHPVLFVNIMFTFLCVLFNLSLGIQIGWFAMWLIVPLVMLPHNAFQSLLYMSLYMRVIPNVKLFSIIICISLFIILIREIVALNKNKTINKYYKILIYYSILSIIPLFYSILINKTINILLIYYFNMINLLFLIYLLKNNLNKNIIIMYAYGIIISSIISLICYSGGLYDYILNYNRFCAYMPLCNSLGVSCVVCISAIYMLAENDKISKKYSWLLIFALSIIGLCTLSKSFLITFTLIAFVVVIREFYKSRSKRKFLLISLILVVVLSPIVLSYGLIMFKRFFVNNEYTNIVNIITTGRLEKWLIYLKPYSKKLYSIIFGLGLGFDFNTEYSSHNFYVGYLTKLGVVGLLAILGFIYLILFNKNKNNLKLKYLPILVIMLIGIVEDFSFNTFNFVPAVIAFISTYKSSIEL